MKDFAEDFSSEEEWEAESPEKENPEIEYEVDYDRMIWLNHNKIYKKIQ